MKKVLLLVFVLSGQLFVAQESAVQKTIETFFVGFHARDSVIMLSVCHRGMVLQSVSEKPAANNLESDSLEDFVKGIISIPEHVAFEEKILSYDVRVDGAMAQAWTPYEFYINGKLTHKGVNSFQLFRENDNADSWKIIYVVDTRRK